MAGIGKMADMVEGEIARRIAHAIAAPAGMKGRGDAELAAFLPERVVIMVAVDAELVEGLGMAGDFRIGPACGRQLPAHPAAEHADLAAELFGDEFELGDRLL